MIVPFVTREERTVETCGGTPIACPVSADADEIVENVPKVITDATTIEEIFLLIIFLPSSIPTFIGSSCWPLQALDALTSRYP